MESVPLGENVPCRESVPYFFAVKISILPVEPIALDAAQDTRLTINAAPTAVQNPEISKPGHDPRDERDHAGIQHEQEKPQRQDRQRQREDERQRPDEGVDHAEHQRRDDQLRRGLEYQAVEDFARDPQTQRGDRGAQQESDHRSYSSGLNGRGR